jgi:hypothetical protein
MDDINVVDSIIRTEISNDSKVDPHTQTLELLDETKLKSDFTEEKLLSQPYRIVNIQNLPRKQQLCAHGFSKHEKIRSLSKSYETKPEDVYYFDETTNSPDRIIYQNNFLGSFFSAYNVHGDVVLSPDEIWMMINFFFSKYVDSNAEKLRSKFVKHQGKMKLVVIEHSTSVEESLAMEKQWDYFFDQIFKQIDENTLPGTVEALQCDFSTTTHLHRVISTSIIMNSFKSYFSYGRMIMMCGINNVYFTGFYFILF